MSLSDLWIEGQRGLKPGLGEAHAVTPQFDPSGEQSSFGGLEVVIGHVCKLGEGLIGAFARGRVLCPQHRVERGWPAEPAEALEGDVDAVKASGHEICLGLRPDRVDIRGGPAWPVI
jgi:hypothetical protein